MGAGSEAESAVAIESQSRELSALERPESGPFVWDGPSVYRCARAFLGTAALVFVSGVAIGAYAPGLPTRVLGLIEAVNLWPSAYLSHLVPIFFFILLSNIKSAMIAGLLGPLGAWVSARANAGPHSPARPRSRLARLAEAVTCLLARGVIWAGRRVHPKLADERQDFAARTGAALAALVPFMALGLNGLVLGLWMAEALLQGWLMGLGRMGLLLLPHAPVELPAFVLASAVGLQLASKLVPQRPEHDAAWQQAKAKRLITSDRVAQSLGLVVGLLAIAAALELYAIVW
jgi:hypothetical protein